MAPKTPPNGRTSIKGVRSKLSDDQRDGVTNSKKERIMKYYHEYTMQKTIDKYYGGLQPQQQKSKKRLIYKWLKQEEAIVNAVASGRGNLQKNRAEGLSTVLSKDDEGMIARWVRDLRREGVPVSPFMLQTHAKEVAEDAGIPVDKFSASSSWRKRF